MAGAAIAAVLIIYKANSHPRPNLIDVILTQRKEFHIMQAQAMWNLVQYSYINCCDPSSFSQGTLYLS